VESATLVALVLRLVPVAVALPIPVPVLADEDEDDLPPALEVVCVPAAVWEALPVPPTEEDVMEASEDLVSVIEPVAASKPLETVACVTQLDDDGTK
jgi:hypothetical protein